MHHKRKEHKRTLEAWSCTRSLSPRSRRCKGDRAGQGLPGSDGALDKLLERGVSREANGGVGALAHHLLGGGGAGKGPR